MLRAECMSGENGNWNTLEAPITTSSSLCWREKKHCNCTTSNIEIFYQRRTPTLGINWSCLLNWPLLDSGLSKSNDPVRSQPSHFVTMVHWTECTEIIPKWDSPSFPSRYDLYFSDVLLWTVWKPRHRRLQRKPNFGGPTSFFWLLSRLPQFTISSNNSDYYKIAIYNAVNLQPCLGLLHQILHWQLFTSAVLRNNIFTAVPVTRAFRL